MRLNSWWVTEKNQRENLKIPGDKWKLRHHNPKPVTKGARIYNGEKTTSSINGVGKTGEL